MGELQSVANVWMWAGFGVFVLAVLVLMFFGTTMLIVDWFNIPVLGTSMILYLRSLK